jgi:hypothetical protein
MAILERQANAKWDAALIWKEQLERGGKLRLVVVVSFAKKLYPVRCSAYLTQILRMAVQRTWQRAK